MLLTISFFELRENKRVIKRLFAAGVNVEDMPVRKGELPLKGKTFVFTGELENLPACRSRLATAVPRRTV